MDKTLILTGRSSEHLDYALAAAIALKHFSTAEVSSMSKRRLPEFLESVTGFTQIIILGISLLGDPDRLAKALARLKKQSVKVSWISGIDFPESIGDNVRNGFDSSSISPSGSVSHAVAELFDMDYAEWQEFSDESNPIYQSYLEYQSAAEYAYRSDQNEDASRQLIQHIANHDKNPRWSKSEEQMLNQFRQYGPREILGKSPEMEEMRKRIDLITNNERIRRILILGESGCGKENIARSIHTSFHRKHRRGQPDEPFVAFNCASANPELQESTFCGHTKGAFTGAQDDHAGLFEEADGGTLFLDEIGDLRLETQGILLRILEEGHVRRIGDNKKETPVNVRVIAATNRDLPTMVREGRFRLDLYQRLSVIQLEAPALRKHKEDIPLLAHSYRSRNKMGGGLTRAQIDALMDYDYPGNVRELYTLLERAFAYGETDYRKLINEHKRLNAALLPETTTEVPDNLDEVIRLHIRRVYEKYNKNVTHTADALGIARNTVRKYLPEA